MKISFARWSKLDASRKMIKDGKRYIWLDSEKSWHWVDISRVEISPIYGELTISSPWEGNCQKKPWEYPATAVIPCLNTSETLPICIELLRLQTKRPFIVIIDTGSQQEHLEKTLQLRDEDVEVHSLFLNGVMHPSDYPAMAMDMAMSICRTKHLFATHADVFIKRRDFLETMIDMCSDECPVVGYELSPRQHNDWKGMVSHTASMYHMKTMDKIGFGWSLRRLCNDFDIADYKPDPMRPNWPDTEILGNYILRRNNIKCRLIGHEENQQRTDDEYIDHFRSYTSGKMYSPDYFIKARAWFEDALTKARIRIEEWKNG